MGTVATIKIQEPQEERKIEEKKNVQLEKNRHQMYIPHQENTKVNLISINLTN